MSIDLISRNDIPRAQSLQSGEEGVRASVIRTLCATIAMVLAVPTVANAAETADAQYRVKILPQPLGTALQAFANQSGIQIVFFSKLTEGHDAPGLSGAFTPEIALGTLLRGTDLTFHQLNENTIEVLPGSALRKISNDDTSLPAVMLPLPVEASETGNSRWPLRLARGDHDRLRQPP